MDNTVYNNMLVFGDPHMPGHHKDMIAFLMYVNRTYGPFDKVVLNGDGPDSHAINLYGVEPDMYGDHAEIKATRRVVRQIHFIFPELDYNVGNHEARHFRTSRSTYRDVPLQKLYRFAKGWNVQDSGLYNLPHNNKVFIKHQIAGSTKAALAKHTCCIVQSHYHAIFDLLYSRTSTGEVFGATIGCLADRDHAVARYGAQYVQSPVTGCLVIRDGQPQLIKMVEDEDGNWAGDPMLEKSNKTCDRCGSSRLHYKATRTSKDGNDVYLSFSCSQCSLHKRVDTRIGGIDV